MQVKKQQLGPELGQWTGSKLRKVYMSRLCIVTLLIYLYAEYITWNAGLDEAQARIKSARKNINNLTYADDTTLMAESEKELAASWWKWKRRVKKLA